MQRPQIAVAALRQALRGDLIEAEYELEALDVDELEALADTFKQLHQMANETAQRIQSMSA